MATVRILRSDGTRIVRPTAPLSKDARDELRRGLDLSPDVLLYDILPGLGEAWGWRPGYDYEVGWQGMCDKVLTQARARARVAPVVRA